MKTVVPPPAQPANKAATPAQETAKELANKYPLRMLTILEAYLEQALLQAQTVKKGSTDLIENSYFLSPDLRVNSYYFFSFMLFLKKHNPTALKNSKHKKLLSERTLKDLIADLESSLEIEHGIEWSITTSPSFYAVSGTVTNQASPHVIYATNGYVEVAFIRKEEEEVEKLHKQPRSYLKSMSQLVGKATNETSLFSMPIATKRPGEGNYVREVISRNTAVLGQLLLQLWQGNNEKELVIENLSPIAQKMGQTNYEIKIYLLYLGGYTYPIVNTEGDKLSLTVEQLFKIKFVYGSKVKEKYSSGQFTAIGNDHLNFIKDEPIEKVVIEPNPVFINAIDGKGLGNVLVVNDKFVQLALSITDMAYKIFTYSASNKPNQKIAEDKLIKHLGLERQIKTQGKPRVRATILKGLQELKDKEHIKSYSYDEVKAMYSFTYSDKYVKHQDGKKAKTKSLAEPL